MTTSNLHIGYLTHQRMRRGGEPRSCIPKASCRISVLGSSPSLPTSHDQLRIVRPLVNIHACPLFSIAKGTIPCFEAVASTLDVSRGYLQEALTNSTSIPHLRQSWARMHHASIRQPPIKDWIIICGTTLGIPGICNATAREHLQLLSHEKGHHLMCFHYWPAAEIITPGESLPRTSIRWLSGFSRTAHIAMIYNATHRPQYTRNHSLYSHCGKVKKPFSILLHPHLAVRDSVSPENSH